MVQGIVQSATFTPLHGRGDHKIGYSPGFSFVVIFLIEVMYRGDLALRQEIAPEVLAERQSLSR